MYAGTLTGAFVYDDVSEILTNPAAHSLAAIPRLLTVEFWQRPPGEGVLYRPLTAATIPPLFVLGGGRAWPFHAANLALHAAVSVLLAAVVGRLMGRPRVAWTAGLLFALHPVHAEAVAWISGRSELLWAAAGAAAWRVHLEAREGRRPAAAAGAAALLAASLAAKETAVSLPFLFAAGDLLYPAGGTGGGGPVRAWLRSAAFRLQALYAGVLLLWGGARFAVLGGIVRRPDEVQLLNPLAGEGFWPARPFTFLRILGRAVRESVLPGRACLDYGYDQIPLARGLLHADVAAVLLAAAAACVWAISRRGRPPGPNARGLLLAGAAFALPWLPVSSLLEPALSIFSERNLYVPSLGACIAAGTLVEAATAKWGRRRIAAAAVGVAAALMAAATWARAAAFKDPLTLFATAAGNCPRSARARMLHGLSLEEAGRMEEAVRAYEAALDIAPEYAAARAELARALGRLGRRDEAARQARAARASVQPGWVETRLAVAAALREAGLAGEANEEMARLRREHPDDESVLFAAAESRLREGRLVEAQVLFQSQRDTSPWNPAGHNGLGAVLLARGDLAGAREAFRRSLALDPYHGGSLYNLAVAALDDGSGGPALAEEAARSLRRYVRLTTGDGPAWARLAQARARLGRRAEAEEALAKALAADPAHPLTRRVVEDLRSGPPAAGGPAP